MQKVAKLPATVLDPRRERHGQGAARAAAAPPVRRCSSAPFVAVNLAAIPRELVESTLFGHEKGSFTGAIRQQIGKFELASGGTLFLDEIGDLRLELQAKLLRALQENEIERIGGTHPDQDQLPSDRGDQRGSGACGEGGAVPRGPVLPPADHPHPHAGAA